MMKDRAKYDEVYSLVNISKMDVQIGRFREIFSTKLAVMPYSSFVFSKFTRIARIFMADVTFLGTKSSPS